MSSVYRGEAFFEGVRERIVEGVDAAAQALVVVLKRDIGTQGPPRSKPGRPPHRDSGDLQQSVDATDAAYADGTVSARVGTDLMYGLYLEYGTGRSARTPRLTKHYGTPNQIDGIAPRPWLGPGLRQNQQRLAKVIFGQD